MNSMPGFISSYASFMINGFGDSTLDKDRYIICTGVGRQTTVASYKYNSIRIYSYIVTFNTHCCLGSVMIDMGFVTVSTASPKEDLDTVCSLLSYEQVRIFSGIII